MILLLFITGTLYIGCSSQYQYHFVSNRVNWTEAQSHCRGAYTDLATLCSEGDVNRMIATLPQNFKGEAWIGLERGDVWRWQWSFSNKDFYTGDDLNFRNWRKGHPAALMEDRCAVVESNGQWFDDNCMTSRQFLCFNESAMGDMKYVLIKENRSWRQAQNVCREMHTDLASVRNTVENKAIRAKVSGQAWIGLFSDPWVWSDQSNSSFRFWEPNQPNNFAQIQICATTRYTDMLQFYQWNDIRCNLSRSFICYSDEEPVTADPLTTVPYTTGSAEQTTTPAQIHHTNHITATANTHTVVASSTTASISTATSHSRDLTSSLGNTISAAEKTVTTEDVTHLTGSVPTETQYTGSATTDTTLSTDFTPFTSHPDFTQTDHTRETQLSTTMSALPQTSTEKSETATTHGLSDQVTTSEEEITTHSTVHQLTDQTSSEPTPTSSLFKDMLVLIQENVTWIEALTYCNTHHLDLVSVTDEHMQQVVTEKVVNASTSHVWLGLRYTCKFSFWFWTGSDSVCYQNWAPGHGPGGQRECGLSGALESSRGKQWVSLADTHKLNFICQTQGIEGKVMAYG